MPENDRNTRHSATQTMTLRGPDDPVAEVPHGRLRPRL